SAAAKPEDELPTWIAVMPHRASAGASAPARAALSGTTRQRREAGPATGPAVPGRSKTAPNRALDPPVDRCRSSAGPRTTGTSVSSEAAKSAVSAVRTASISRGGEIRDSSGPAEKMSRSEERRVGKEGKYRLWTRQQ